MRTIKVLLLVILATVWTTALGFGAEKRFHATLTGDDEVPAVKTKAKGKVDFALSKDGKELSYNLSVKNITNASAAHVHKGKKGENGPPVLDLFKGPKRNGKVSGMLAKGIVSDKNLIGELQGKTIEDLIALIKSGDAYVNVHTDAAPDGEIRGQLK